MIYGPTSSLKSKKTSLIPNHLKLNESINYNQIKKYVDGFNKPTIGDQVHQKIQESLPQIQEGGAYTNHEALPNQTIG